MPSHIVVNSLGLTYKSTVGMSAATIPDVCKTPSPGGPIPIPYPNFASQSSLKGGTKTVKAEGSKMIAVKGSQYGRSNGDEAGTVGGVKSNVNMKATDWITYSFDVKMDGKNTCRHTDKKFHNNQNTVDAQGNVDPALAAALGVLQKIANECSKDINKKEFRRMQAGEKKSTCQKLGQEKHKCCEKKIQKHRSNPKPDGDPPLKGEQAYNRPSFKKGKAVQPVDKKPVAVDRGQVISNAIEKAKKANPTAKGKALQKAIGKEIGKALNGLVFPDAAIVGPPKRMVDFKFACPETHRSKKTKRKYRPPQQSKRQRMAHNALGDRPTITISGH